jgi:hypothetical protein
MFHYFKIPYFTCTFFTKFTYNEYIGPYVLSHVVLRFSPVNSPSSGAPMEFGWRPLGSNHMFCTWVLRRLMEVILAMHLLVLWYRSKRSAFHLPISQRNDTRFESWLWNSPRKTRPQRGLSVVEDKSTSKRSSTGLNKCKRAWDRSGN